MRYALGSRFECFSSYLPCLLSYRYRPSLHPCAPLHHRYVDCMPTEEILPMPQEQIASILDVCLNTSKLRAFQDGSRRPLLVEVQKEYVQL